MPSLAPSNSAAASAPAIQAPSLGVIYRDDFFQYAQLFTFTAGTENFTPTVPIQFDAHFVCVETTYSNSAEIGVAANGYVIVNGGGVVQISDASSQRFLSNTTVPLNSLFGSAREPFVWPIPHLFRANGGIGINLTGAGATMAGATVRLVFSGYKVPIGSLPHLGL